MATRGRNYTVTRERQESMEQQMATVHGKFAMLRGAAASAFSEEEISAALEHERAAMSGNAAVATELAAVAAEQVDTSKRLSELAVGGQTPASATALEALTVQLRARLEAAEAAAAAATAARDAMAQQLELALQRSRAAEARRGEELERAADGAGGGAGTVRTVEQWEAAFRETHASISQSVAVIERNTVIERAMRSL